MSTMTETDKNYAVNVTGLTLAVATDLATQLSLSVLNSTETPVDTGTSGIDRASVEELVLSTITDELRGKR
jgi:hypothetical protein